MKKIGSLLSLGVIFTSSAFSYGDVSISASVDRNKIALNESVSVSVNVSGSGNLPSPQVPSLPNFNIYSSGQSQNISFINGQVSSSISYAYILSPKSQGKFTVGSFSVVVDGKTYNTQPIEIEVMPAGPSVPSQRPPEQARPAGGQSPGAFVTMTIDKSRVFVGEPVLLSFRFYYRVPLLANPEYQAPDKTGFTFEDLPPPRNFEESVHGVGYHVTEIKTALFPVKLGEMTIPPAGLKIQVQDFSRNPFSDDFFSQFFGGGARAYLLKTDPVRLNVLALPAKDMPSHFSGAVGNFKISASADKTRGTVGEPVTLTYTISGAGNIKTIGDPVFPSFTGFRKYDTASSLNVDSSKGKVEGSKVYKVILVPEVSGTQTVPPVSFSYFDPISKKYEIASTPSFRFEFSPSKSGAVVISPITFAPAQIKEVNQDIRYLKTEPLPEKSFSWIYKKIWLKILNLLPVLGLTGALGLRLRRAALEKNPEKRRFSSAYLNAKKSVEICWDGNIDNKNSAPVIFDAVQNYFADKMLASASGLSFRSVESFLRDRQIAEDFISELRSFWTDLEVASYAPERFRSADPAETARKGMSILMTIENQLGNFKSKRPSRFSAKLLILLSILSALVISATGLQRGSAASFDVKRERPQAGIQYRDLNEQFQKANRLYQEGKFEDAKNVYEEIAKGGYLNDELEYNLGNSCYRLGQTGQALVHWLRAYRCNPLDSDLRHNIKLSTYRTGAPFFSGSPLLYGLQFLYYSLNLNELTLGLSLVLWLCCLFWISRICNRLNILYSIALFAFASCWWGGRFYEERVRNAGIVTVPKAEIRSGPGNQFGVGFTVPEGRQVLILDQETDSQWMEIGIPREGIKGWVPQDSVTRI